ncbi:hypothetical protein DRW07_09555 [Alteromonas sediminis]|uniref:DUF3570 domain-containing protein n=1 Tax=Alteromonas sediminis TaxID=2259342 RepID=A0A3N5XZ73_9ALTE|nr:hypothetical protein [Alteromonas sediminis]RPJ66332.1 hypothetical protein DRW07_09555 [Alteromonas sediminis]
MVRQYATGMLILTLAVSRFCNAEEETPPPPHEWLDRWHVELSDSMDTSAQWLDRFFALEGSEESTSARAKGRIRLGWSPRSRDLSDVSVRFRINVTLPALKDRVDLILSDNEEDLNEQALESNRPVTLNEQDSANLAFRFRASEDAKISYRIGGGRRDQLFVKTRYRDSVNFDNRNQIIYDAEVYYYTRDQLGAELGFTWQLQNVDKSFSRVSNRFYYRDISKDWRWRHEFHHIKQTGPKSATILSLFTEGLTEPSYQVEEVYTSLRWRTNPLREWLYFEVEPYLTWLREEDFDTSYGVAFRVEVFYGGYTTSL